MSGRKHDAVYLSDMLTRAHLAADLARGMTQADLSPTDARTAAIERWLEIIGEAARNVSSAFKQAHPQVPWSKVVGSRNILAHVYDDVDYDVIWRIVTVHLPELIAQLEGLVPQPPLDPEP